MNTVDYGAQRLTFDYGNQASSLSFNKLLHKLVEPGIYSGGIPSRDISDPTKVVVPPLICAIETSNEEETKQLTVRVETTEDVLIEPASSAHSLLVLRLEWNNVENSFMEILAIQDASKLDTDLVLGRCTFVGGVLQASFDLTERSYVSKNGDTIELGEGLVSNPTGGTATNVAGDEYLPAFFNEIMARLRDLSGVTNASVLLRHLDKGTADTKLNAKALTIGGTGVTVGGPASDLGASTTILAALQALADALKDGSGADDDSVGLRILKVGLNPDQLNSEALALGVAIQKTLDAGLDPLNLPNSTATGTALLAIAEALRLLSVEVGDTQDAIASHSSALSAVNSKVDNTSFLPVGSILMFDGTGWEDNVTLPGWYACDGTQANVNRGCPDLRTRFIKGGVPGTKGVDFGALGGANSVALTTLNLPAHQHSISHEHTLVASDTDLAHTHGMQHKHKFYSWRDNLGWGRPAGVTDSGTVEFEHDTGDSPANTGSALTTHKHTITGGGHSGVSGDGGFGATPISTEPKYYSVIYIRKCS